MTRTRTICKTAVNELVKLSGPVLNRDKYDRKDKLRHQIAKWHIGISLKYERIFREWPSVQSRLSKALAKGQNSPNCSKIVLHFLKLSSILGNFMIILSNDFSEVPCDALCCIASTIFASSFKPWKLRLWVSCRPSTAPMLAVQRQWPRYSIFFFSSKEAPDQIHTEQLKAWNRITTKLSVMTHACQLFQQT